MKTIGRHLVAEFYECTSSLLDDVDGIRSMMLEAAAVVGATVMGEVFSRFEPDGVSGAVVIAESHLSVHTWPGRRYVAVDIFTCGGLDPHPGFRLVGERLGAAQARTQEIVRGLPDDIAADRELLPADVELITLRPEITLLVTAPRSS